MPLIKHGKGKIEKVLTDKEASKVLKKVAKKEKKKKKKKDKEDKDEKDLHNK